ncbi:MAG: hypothetical protein AMXMBFR84_44040 [Candidatus Hydrogenedentota bacterium]
MPFGVLQASVYTGGESEIRTGVDDDRAGDGIKELADAVGRAVVHQDQFVG